MKISRFIPVLALTLCPGLRLHAQTNVVDGILAVINDTVITRQQVEDFIDPAIRALQQNSAGQSEAAFQQKLTAAINDGLEQLVERQLILHDFDVQGYRMPDSYLDDMVQERIRDRFSDRVILMKTLQAQGETFESFRNSVRDQVIETFMRSKNVAQEIVISPYKIETYYQAHQDDFKVEDEIKLRMIVLNKTSTDDTNTVIRARQIRAEITAGAPFADIAKIYSEEPEHNQGGDHGWIGRSVLRKEYSEVVGKLAPGQVSDVVDLPESCCLLLVEAAHPAHVKPLNEIRDDIEKNLRAQEQARLEQDWIAKLKAKAFVLYF